MIWPRLVEWAAFGTQRTLMPVDPLNINFRWKRKSERELSAWAWMLGLAKKRNGEG